VVGDGALHGAKLLVQVRLKSYSDSPGCWRTPLRGHVAGEARRLRHGEPWRSEDGLDDRSADGAAPAQRRFSPAKDRLTIIAITWFCLWEN
jgi:hypothetical protein